MMKLAVGLGLTAFIAVVLVISRSPSSGDSCEPRCESPVTLPELEWTERDDEPPATAEAEDAVSVEPAGEASEPTPVPAVTPTPTVLPSCAFFVATDGDDDDGTGTEADPWATITHAARTVPDDDCVVLVESGTYVGRNRITRRFETSLTIQGSERHGAVLEAAGSVIDIDAATNITFDGFEIRHQPGGENIVVTVSGAGEVFADGFALVNSIVHDSYDDDLIKINQGVRNVLLENNVTYNAGPGEHHYDLNAIEDVVLRNNIMFNDWERSGRTPQLSKMFVIIKDSNGSGLDVGGSKRVLVDGNVFIGWSIAGGEEAMIKAGNDGKPYHEAIEVVVQNNLFLSNGPDVARSVLGAAGVRDLVFRNNTINHATAQYQGYRVEVKGDNPPNEDITICNNVFSATEMRDFSKVDDPTTGLSEYSNVYWNDGRRVPDFENSFGVVADPGLADAVVVLPTGGADRAALETLVMTHGRPNDAVIDMADPTCAPGHDILGAPRTGVPDAGALEVG